MTETESTAEVKSQHVDADLGPLSKIERLVDSGNLEEAVSVLSLDMPISAKVFRQALTELGRAQAVGEINPEQRNDERNNLGSKIKEAAKNISQKEPEKPKMVEVDLSTLFDTHFEANVKALEFVLEDKKLMDAILKLGNGSDSAGGLSVKDTLESLLFSLNKGQMVDPGDPSAKHRISMDVYYAFMEKIEKAKEIMGL